jgi:molecular chaperone Hsp33
MPCGMSRAWLSLREHQDYPPAVQQLLGEAVGAVVLLAATLKFNGTLTLQLQGKGLVNLLVAQCTTTSACAPWRATNRSKLSRVSAR